jgi:aspartate aminotransferase
MLQLTQNNSVIRAMFEEGNRLAAEFGRENVFDFSLGNPNFPPPDAVREAIIDVLNTVPPTEIHGYMSNAGYPEVRAAVADSLNRRFGTEYDARGIVMTVGAAGGLNVVLKTLINPGDEVIALAPYFVEYGNYARNWDGALVVVPANPPTFQPNADALTAAITERTKAVIINSPNNPTGVVYTRETLQNLADALTRKSREYGHPIYIIADEPYRELSYGTDVPWIPSVYRDTLVCYSWSKSLSLPGERIGYIAVAPDAADYELLTDALGIATRVIGFVNAPSLMQLAVARVLDVQPNLAGYAENRKLLYDGLTALGFDCVYPDGAFYLWVKAPNGDDKAFAAAAKQYNILIVPGSSFAGAGYVRIAYCVAKSTIEGSMAGFAKLAGKYGLSKLTSDN